MPSASEISEQVTRESERRARLGVPVVASGVLYLLSSIILSSTLSGAPTVGLLQGLAPALRGEANPALSPHTAEIKYISHHAFGLVAGGVMAGIAIGFLVLLLRFLFDSVRFRRSQTWAAGGPLVLVGGAGVAVLNVVHEVLLAIESHKFATGHDFTNHAADRALLNVGSVNVVLAFLGFLSALALVVGMVAVMTGSMRAGLLPRWLSILGIFSGLFLLPWFATGTLQLITAFWLVAAGILLLGRWPKGDPPAWAAGEARPWPSQAELRAAKQVGEGRPALSTAGAEVAPAPARPASSGTSRKRRRKRRARS
jgi:hypothetical protein